MKDIDNDYGGPLIYRSKKKRRQEELRRKEQEKRTNKEVSANPNNYLRKREGGGKGTISEKEKEEEGKGRSNCCIDIQRLGAKTANVTILLVPADQMKRMHRGRFI